MYRLLYAFKVFMIAACIAFQLTGCSTMQADHQAADMQPNAADGPMEGPGLFTGEDGEVTILKR
jgi:hypothetical protein